jgi:hypothetical protein
LLDIFVHVFSPIFAHLNTPTVTTAAIIATYVPINIAVVATVKSLIISLPPAP